MVPMIRGGDPSTLHKFPSFLTVSLDIAPGPLLSRIRRRAPGVEVLIARSTWHGLAERSLLTRVLLVPGSEDHLPRWHRVTAPPRRSGLDGGRPCL